jgi:hypothetical protein
MRLVEIVLGGGYVSRSDYQGARLRHVGIRTNDITRTVSFYSTVFGLELLEEDPNDPSAVLGDGVVADPAHWASVTL